MKNLILLFLVPIIGFSQTYASYVDKLIAEKYGKKPWHQIEEISSIKRTIKDDFGATADLVETYIDLDGKRMILDHEITSFTGYRIERKTYDYTPSGRRFIQLHKRFNYGEEKKFEIYNGGTYTDKRSFPDGIWEERSLPFGVRDGSWQRQEKDPNYLFRKEMAENSGTSFPSRVQNATPILCTKKVYIANHFIEQLVKDRESGYCGAISQNLAKRGTKEVNEKDLKAMVKVFLQDLISTNESYGDFSSEGFYAFNIKNFLFLISLINETDSIIDATFEPLEKDMLGVSLGIFDNNKIVLRIDPQKWERATSLERWYTIYHELGHDVLNLRHGEGGDMMFNFSIDSNYTWEDFFEDRDYMFKYFFDNFNEEKFTSSPKTSYDEIITRDEAVKRLKDAKEMFDMGILTKDEYDSMSKELKPIILDN